MIHQNQEVAMDIIQTSLEDFSIRKAERGDIPTILSLIKDLAQYEDLLKDVKATEEILEKSLFEEKTAHMYLPLYKGGAIGYFIFFYNFSTFEGRPGLYLEDLYIDPQYRGRGYGRKCLSFMAKHALEKDCRRFEWTCLKTNTPSYELYKSLGADDHTEWVIFRLDGEDLKAMGTPEL